MCECVHNVAVAFGITAGGVTVTDTDDATVCAVSGGGGGVCSLLKGAIKFDKNTIQIPIKDTGSAAVIMSQLTLTWPEATNGKLKTVTLNGTAYGGAGSTALDSPATIGTGGVNWTGNTGSRTINKGQSKNLVLTFEHNVDKIASHYSGGAASFGTDASCQVNFLP
jgi:hypothetical protein